MGGPRREHLGEYLAKMRGAGKSLLGRVGSRHGRLAVGPYQ